MGLLRPLRDSQPLSLLSLLMVPFPSSDIPFLLPASTYPPMRYRLPSPLFACPNAPALLSPPQAPLRSLQQTSLPVLVPVSPLSTHTYFRSEDRCNSDQDWRGPCSLDQKPGPQSSAASVQCGLGQVCSPLWLELLP